MSASSEAIERLYRRVLLMIGRGRIKTGKDDGAAQLQQVRLGQYETFDDVPRMAEYGFNSMPPAESDAVMVFVGGNRLDGVIIGTGNQMYRMRNLKPGEVSISDDRGQSVHLSQDGIVIKGGGLPIKIMDSPEMTIDVPTVHLTGNLNIDGDVMVQKNITAQMDIMDQGNKSMRAMRDVFNGHDHTVTKVQPGGGAAKSDPPNQRE